MRINWYKINRKKILSQDKRKKSPTRLVLRTTKKPQKETWTYFYLLKLNTEATI